MPSENGQKSAEDHRPDEPRDEIERGKTGDKAAASDPALAPQETDIAHKEETKPVSAEPAGPEQAAANYFVEPNPKKAIAMFALTSVLIFAALAAIYAYWPRAIP
jgi:hypothetical protein